MINLQLWKDRKKELKLSFQDIADETGVSISTIKDIFRGATAAPRIDTALRIEIVLGLKECLSPFANNLMRTRIGAGLTRVQMANKIGVETGKYADMESGILVIEKPYLQKICDALETTLDALFGQPVSEIENTAKMQIKKEKQLIIDFINFILSDADTIERHIYYEKLSQENKDLFVSYLLYTKEDLICFRDELLHADYDFDIMLAYQNRPELWKNNKQ